MTQEEGKDFERTHEEITDVLREEDFLENVREDEIQRSGSEYGYRPTMRPEWMR